LETNEKEREMPLEEEDEQNRWRKASKKSKRLNNLVMARGTEASLCRDPAPKRNNLSYGANLNIDWEATRVLDPKNGSVGFLADKWGCVSG
jgi:hypothetical protein